MKTAIAILTLALLQIGFLAVTYYQDPKDDFTAYYFLWILVPSTLAAIIFAPRYHFLAAISNAILAGLMFDYLFLQLGYFWPGRPKESPVLAIGYVVIGAALAFVMAGFVHSIVTAIDLQSANSKLSQGFLGFRKGLSFSIICGAVAFPLLAMSGPAGAGVKPNPPFLFAFIIAVCIILIGSTVGIAVGLTHRPIHRDITMAG
ncbi:hypothetical protein N9Y42_03955 [Mariniblastus sp.]|nr:hypothetical protein [Mariniblastus sp.]